MTDIELLADGRPVTAPAGALPAMQQARGGSGEGGTDAGPVSTRAVPWPEHTGDMTIRLSIGDFSRMTYLSVKSLRRYHDMGLLEPAHIDRYTGYRYYEASQVPLGQAIRRFRDLEMPLGQLKDVLHAPDASARNKLIIAHLEHMESALQQTQQTVASLRALLEQPHAPIAVEYRSVAAATAIAISEPVHRADLAAWWSEAFDELHRVLASSSAVRAGSDGALYPDEFFEEERGEIVAFIPVADMPAPPGRPQLMEIPGAELAITVHTGAISELDQTYGALGTFVAEREIGVRGPIREHYVVSPDEASAGPVHHTEVCWPVFRTKGPEPDDDEPHATPSP
jgi:DNA-binding transcriptional MerR regulator